MACRAVGIQKIRENHGIGEPVRHAVLPAQRMGDAVNIADIGTGKGYARAVCRAEHIAAGIHIAAVLIGFIQTADDERRRFFGHGCG